MSDVLDQQELDPFIHRLAAGKVELDREPAAAGPGPFVSRVTVSGSHDQGKQRQR